MKVSKKTFIKIEKFATITLTAMTNIVDGLDTLKINYSSTAFGE